MALKGTLEDLPLTDLFEIFRQDQKSGLLQLVTKTEQGEITLSKGQVIDALLFRVGSHIPLMQGEQALNRLLVWEDASFIFESGPVAQPARVGRPPSPAAELSFEESLERLNDWSMPQSVVPSAVDQALSFEEAVSRLMDWDTEFVIPVAQAPAPLPPPAPAREPKPLAPVLTFDAWLSLGLLPGIMGEGVTLSSAEWRLIGPMLKQASLRELCAASGLPADQALGAARSLAQRGILVNTVGDISDWAAHFSAPSAAEQQPSQAARIPPALLPLPSPPARPPVAVLQPTIPAAPPKAAAPVASSGLLKAIIRRVRAL
jgi:Domain of unknown function (DUF4388)